MTNKFVEEAPFHPGYEDAAYQHEVSPMLAELESFRKINARYLRFSEVIVHFCKSSKISPSTP
ncbi:hypothetical protein ICN42_00660 [Polynucleobacter sp. 71A-WALBACH]|jgi:hypothetical protein|uniref:hypothetical protein n=1 Tax=Polynucleobacter sp. 71A-WALBACH TaxID=2689097 RepID=UPI001C0D1FBF|nr:hypothetical protein [Polynucleobacter sp. 71A-WALBACH]MBU3592609.1 hypothetical protein [Polynucleobacter sp. 71A-WALBACH]